MFGAYVLAASVAGAAEPTPTELAIARRLFKEATELELEAEWELAAAKLKEAILIKDTPGLRFHLAHCEERMGQLVEAMLDYDRARELIAAGVKAPDVEALLEPARRSLEQRLPTLLIVVPAGVPDLSIELNGRPVARSILGRPAPVNPGQYRVTLTAPGYAPFAQDITIVVGDRKRISPQLVPLPDAGGASPEPQPAERRQPAAVDSETRTYVLIAESAVTLAALGTGIGFLLLKNDAQDRVIRAGNAADAAARGTNSSCSNSPTDPALVAACRKLDDAISDYDTAQLVSTIGLVGAGVGAVSIVLTATLWPSRPGTARAKAFTGPSGTFFAIDGVF